MKNFNQLSKYAPSEAQNSTKDSIHGYKTGKMNSAQEIQNRACLDPNFELVPEGGR